jgi:hypothetical protein
MPQAQSITEVLVRLILLGNVPLKAVAIAGEAIAVDARLRDYPQGPTKRTSGDEYYQFLESYEALRQRCEGVVNAYSEARDGHSLIKRLSDIKDALGKLY